MARITFFEEAPHSTGTAHPTQVGCEWKVFDHLGVRYLQLDTFGSHHRENPGRQSQTIQLDRDNAAQLAVIIAQAFPPGRA